MKEAVYKKTLQSIESLIEGENDIISIMASISCELYHAFDYINWAGFYRRIDDETLKVGPYQGTHGCLVINLERGVCGKCAREAKIQIENNVASLEHHIACSSDTEAEIVLPIMDDKGYVRAVLDVDATTANVFDDIDITYLTKICQEVSARYTD